MLIKQKRTGSIRLIGELALAVALCQAALIVAWEIFFVEVFSSTVFPFVSAVLMVLVVTPFIYFRGQAWRGQDNLALTRAMRHSDIALLLLDAEQRIVWANQGFYKMSGYSAEEAEGAQARTLLSSGDVTSGDYQRLETAKLRQEVCKVVLKNKRKDGSLYWADIELRPEFDSRGRFLGYVELCTDITALKNAERSLQVALRDAQSLWNAVATHTIVSVTDRTGRIVEANDAFCQISGYAREELLGQDHRMLNARVQGPEIWREMWAHMAQGKPWRGEVCNRTRSGKLYWVDSLIAPFLDDDGRAEKYVSVRMDITERKAAQAVLQESQDLARMATEAADIGIWTFNAATGAQSWDAHQYRIFGVDPVEHRDTPIFDLWVRHLHPEDAAMATAAFQQTLAHGGDLGMQFRIIRPDGAVRHIKALGTPRRGTDGKVEYVVGVNQDVSDLMLQEAALKQARDEALEASRVKSQFLANVSHEIRTPMHAVMGMLQLLHRTELDLRQADYVSKAQTASQHMVKVIDALLNLSRIESTPFALNPIDFSLAQLMHELGTVAVGNTQGKAIEVVLDIDPELPEYILGDRARLYQVLLSLTDNAVRFTPAGYVSLIARRERAVDGAEKIVFAVQDSGVGIDAQHIDSIFEGFTQVQSTDTREFAGIGLGLTLARRQAQLLGGELQVQSVLGAGSLFSFAIDLTSSGATLLAASKNLLPQRLRSVLVVDDLPAAQRVSLQMAKALGLDGLACASVADVARLLEQRQQSAAPLWDAMLLDWSLPDAPAAQAIEWVDAFCQAQGQRRPLLLVTHTGDMPQDLSALCDRELVDGVLPKPFSQPMLAAMLAHADAKAPGSGAVVVEQLTSRLRGKRILVVEDVELNRLVLESMLLSEGAQVVLAANGALGVRAVQEAQGLRPFDAVLMDLQMPVMDGYAATRFIRHELQLTELPIIAVSANTSEAVVHACLQEGMDRHIGKPVSFDDLVRVLREVMGMDGPDTDLVPLTHRMPLSGETPDAINQPADAPAALAVHWITAADTALRQEIFLAEGLHLVHRREPPESPQLAPSPEDLQGLCTIIVADQLTSCLQARAVWGSAAQPRALLTVLLSNNLSSAEMQEALRAGVQDVLPQRFAVKFLPRHVRRYLAANGALLTAVEQWQSVLDAQRAMDLMQTEVDFYCEILQNFFDEMPRRREELERDWFTDPLQVAHYSHSLKGLARTLGLVRLAEMAFEVEAYAKQCAARELALDNTDLWLQLDAEILSAQYQILRWLTWQSDSQRYTR